ncbi:hypothetical protein [Yinghuangia seranimata]|uniref:hypothetical protein n=1 Tax=Yinghuangia seranimata TaxID=408067 RepID=UPI00248C604B|nr:hypothetical protein [Yinghuangia seranimata]MDI2126941.1 hypothetical protein [Yinghuangia seranimata]
MRTIVAGHTVFSDSEFAELALGIDPELFTGVEGESASERTARLDAARDVLADLRREDPELAAYAAGLLDESAEVIDLPARRTAPGRWAA